MTRELKKFIYRNGSGDGGEIGDLRGDFIINELHEDLIAGTKISNPPPEKSNFTRCAPLS